MSFDKSYTAFVGESRVAAGELEAVLRTLQPLNPPEPILTFEDWSGRQVDFDLRGSIEEVLSKALPPAGRGRPKMGVTSREVTLLPRHWDWLESQPSGASAAIRRLVDDAAKGGPSAKQAMEIAGRVMSSLGGNLPNYEEATRSLYRGDSASLRELIEDWPADVRGYVLRLSEPIAGSAR